MLIVIVHSPPPSLSLLFHLFRNGDNDLESFASPTRLRRRVLIVTVDDVGTDSAKARSCRVSGSLGSQV